MKLRREVWRRSLAQPLQSGAVSQVRSGRTGFTGALPCGASVVHSMEDYSPDDDHVWESFPHEHTRSRAYRWGEDGLLGICDDNGFLCFSLTLWNEHVG
jgi:hypothetical protein